MPLGHTSVKLKPRGREHGGGFGVSKAEKRCANLILQMISKMCGNQKYTGGNSMVRVDWIGSSVRHFSLQVATWAGKG